MAKQCSKCGKQLAILENFGSDEKPLCAECGQKERPDPFLQCSRCGISFPNIKNAGTIANPLCTDCGKVPRCIKCKNALEGDDGYGFSDIKIINNESYCETCYNAQVKEPHETTKPLSKEMLRDKNADSSVIQFEKVYAHKSIIPSFYITVIVNIIILIITIIGICNSPFLPDGMKFLYSVIAVFVVVNFLFIIRYICEALLTVFNIWIKVRNYNK